MVRSALHQRSGAIGRNRRRSTLVAPALSVVFGSLLSTLPIVSTAGWAPDAGFLMLIAWRLLRADAWPAWWAAPLGFVNDIITGAPVGQSVALWPAVMLLLDLADRRTLWRDYWIEWLLAVLLIVANAAFTWRVAAWDGAHMPFSAMLPSALLSMIAFPLAAGVAGLIDRWRLGS